MNECRGTESDFGLWASTQSRNSLTSESSRASSKNAIAASSISGHGDALLGLTLLLLDDPVVSANGLLRNCGTAMIAQNGMSWLLHSPVDTAPFIGRRQTRPGLGGSENRIEQRLGAFAGPHPVFAQGGIAEQCREIFEHQCRTGLLRHHAGARVRAT